MPSQDSPIIKAVKKVLPAVVSIVMTKNIDCAQPRFEQKSKKSTAPIKNQKIRIGGGSGFIVDEKGIILTNRHVIEDSSADYMVILQSGEKIKPEVLARDPINDVAILKIDIPENSVYKKGLPVVECGDSLKLELGQTAIAIGNALGLFKNTVSTGVVSGLSREIMAQSEITQKQTELRGLIQTDAAINPGNSGGPLVDITGKAIGINAAMVFGAENIGFALPINNAKRDLQEFQKYGRIRQPFLGVRYIPITQELKEDFNLPVDCGVLVIAEPDIPIGITQAVIPGSPAAKAGIQETDIILEIKNKKISQEQSIPDILLECEIGQKTPLKILRRGKEKTLKIILVEKK